MSSHGAPASDLPQVINTPATHIVATIPLKPTARIFGKNPSFLLPFGQWTGSIYLEVIQGRVVPCMTKLRVLEPVARKFLRAIGEIFSAKDPESEHLFGRQLRAKTSMEILACRFRAEINVSLLHQIVNGDSHRFHLK